MVAYLQAEGNTKDYEGEFAGASLGFGQGAFSDVCWLAISNALIASHVGPRLSRVPWARSSMEVDGAAQYQSSDYWPYSSLSAFISTKTI